MRPKLLSALFSCSALLASALLPASSPAQSTPALATPEVRITAPVTTGGPLVTLKGNTHPLAQAQYDRGAAAATLATGRLRLQFARGAAQQQALTEYLGSLNDPNSPSYHKWLTPESFGANFGIADADLQTVQTWLASQGFKVESVPKSRNFIEFSGTLGQVAKAFHTSIHTYSIAGVNHLSNVSDPQIPAALAPVVAGVSPLNDFRAKPMHIARERVQVSSQGQTIKSVPSSQSSASPAFTGLIGKNDVLYLTPADAATIYNAANPLNRNYTGSAPGNQGAGVNVGIVNYSNLNLTDYANYRRLFLNESSPKPPNLVIDGVDPGIRQDGNGTEALIDAEFASALAPQANIYLYTSSSDLLEDGLDDAILRAIEDNTVSILSVSYGNCEYILGQSGNALFNEFWEQAAAQGITAVVSTGDSGSASCDAEDGLNTAASGGLSVSGIASTPFNVAVGGTDFNALLNNFNLYVSPINNANHGSANGYIPENPWNDSISNNPVGSLTGNTVATYNGSIILAAGSGGASTAGACTTTDQRGGCLAPGYPAPPFQTGLSVSGPHPSGVRYIPDVSLFASPGDQHPVTWALCSDTATDGGHGVSFNNASGTGSTTYTDCVPAGDGSFYLEPVGGTSAAAPAFAGILAQVVASLPAGTRLGVANNVLYNLFSKGNTGVFNDVTTGNTSVPCASGSLDCILNNASQYFLNGYDAGPGYDLATGLGSVNISNLVSQWTTASFAPTTLALQVNGSTNPITITHGTGVTLAVQATPSTATGLVSITGKSGQGPAGENDYIALNGGSGSLGTTYLPGSGSSSYALQAYYPGDINNAASKSNTVQVTVNPENSTPNLFIQTQDPIQGTNTQGAATASYGQYIYAYIAPSPSSGATNYGTASGTAILSFGSTSITQSLGSQGRAAFALDTLLPGTYSFSAHYGGDLSYNASTTPAAVPLNISKGPTAFTLTPASPIIAASGSTTVKVELDTDSVGAYPTGNITLTLGGTSFGSSGITKGLTGYGTVAEVVTFTVPGSALASGSNTLTASYSGDTNYNGTSATTVITNSGGSSTAPGFSVSSQNTSLTISAPGQSSAPDTINVTPTNGFSGSVNLTCQVQFTGVGSAPTCSLANSSVNLANGTAATTTVTVHTTAASASLTAPISGKANPGAPALAMRLLAGGGGFALCGVLLWGIPARRKGWTAMRSLTLAFLVIGVLGGVLGMTGCGGTSTSNNNGSGTATGSYTLLVTGTSGSIKANTQISVTVQ